ncbi:unnamed protein product [Mycena citricolor]|uniref:F-box domain-containing protein n=1 Tax=Mycena citricolor TaxID=2018698 RepID=A0AAD2Q2A7_9AGAR|nr:unnamed protein product [Mycena citricolor]
MRAEEEASRCNGAAHDSLGCIEARIPEDILQLIFQAGVRQFPHPAAFPSATPPLEIALSHVNRRWRAAALRLAELWSRVTASPFEPPEKLDVYLQRSCGHALGVCLFLMRDFWSAELLTRIRPCLGRIARLHLVTDFVAPDSLVSAHFRAFDMPQLRTFLFTPLDTEFNPAAGGGKPLLSLAGGSPLLSSVRLNGPVLNLLRLPLSGITQLCLVEERFPLPFRSICEILQQCLSLVKFAFIGHSQRPHRRLAAPIDVLPFRLPELRYLALSNGGNADVILSAMTATKLDTIRLCNFDEGDLAYFLQLPPASRFPVLASMTLLDNTFSIADYHDIARLFPAVRAFACSNSLYTDDALEFLVPLPNSESATHMPWPNLDTLSFSEAQFQEKHQAMLCSLVAARIALSAPIRRLFLGSANRVLLDGERLEWLKERLVIDESPEMPEGEEMKSLVHFSGDVNLC